MGTLYKNKNCAIFVCRITFGMATFLVKILKIPLLCAQKRHTHSIFDYNNKNRSNQFDDLLTNAMNSLFFELQRIAYF